jgi:uncharacterized protein YciI
MHYVIVAKDLAGPESHDRRLKARSRHLAGIGTLKRTGRVIDGGAILDDADEMIGSVVLCDFPDRASLDAYLKNEIYVRNNVWGDILIYRLRRVDWSLLDSSIEKSGAEQNRGRQ